MRDGNKHTAVFKRACPQVDRAAVLFGNIENMYKQTLIVNVLTHTADMHSDQNKTLRTADAAIDYELRMMQGGMDKTMQLTMAQLSDVKAYPSMGIEKDWAPLSISLTNPRVIASNEFLALLFDLVA